MGFQVSEYDWPFGGVTTKLEGALLGATAEHEQEGHMNINKTKLNWCSCQTTKQQRFSSRMFSCHIYQ